MRNGTRESCCGRTSPARQLDDQIRRLVRDCVAAKARAHGIGDPAFRQPDRAMYQIGG